MRQQLLEAAGWVADVQGSLVGAPAVGQLQVVHKSEQAQAIQPEDIFLASSHLHATENVRRQ